MFIIAATTANATPQCDTELMHQAGCRATEAFPLQAPPINESRRNVLLPNGQAVTFKPREDTVLRLTEGRLWITFEAPASGPAPRNGDHFIAAGDCFYLLAGEVAVLEAIGVEPSAYFDLEPVMTLPWRAASQQFAANGQLMLARALLAATRLLDGIHARRR